MKKLFVLAFILEMSIFSHSQIKSDSIEITNSRLGIRFYRTNRRLKSSQLKNILEPNKLAYKEFKVANKYKAGYAFEFLGGFLIGWPLGNLIDGTKPNLLLAIAGISSACISIPLLKAYKEHIKKSVSIFNEQLNIKGSLIQIPSLYLSYNRILITIPLH
jgi:hypothetical protein